MKRLKQKKLNEFTSVLRMKNIWKYKNWISHLKFNELSGFQNLRNFQAPFTQLTSKSANLLMQLPNLDTVNLAHTRYFTTFDIWISWKIWIILYDLRFCDEGLKLLCETCDLKQLDLSETRVTDESVHQLLEMESLQVFLTHGPWLMHDESNKLFRYW